jgi:hypothetical protein
MDELIEISKTTKNFNVVFVFSDEKVENYERGFITKQLIEKYAPPEKYSVFINGSEQLLSLISTQIAELGLERKDIRLNIGNKNKEAKANPDFPPEFLGKTFELKVKKDGKVLKTIPCNSEETILVGGYEFNREFLAKMLYREGGAMNWVGQVYTCSAILNFCDVNGRSLWDAGHDPNAFSVAYTVDSAVPTEMNYEVVDYVLSGGRIDEICYFRSGGRYHSFGVPVCEVDGHYFSVKERK